MKKIIFATALILSAMSLSTTSAYAQNKPKKVVDNTPIVAADVDFAADENATEATAATAAEHRTSIMATRYNFTAEQRSAVLALNTAYLIKTAGLKGEERTAMREQYLNQMATSMTSRQRRLLILDYQLWRKTH